MAEKKSAKYPYRWSDGSYHSRPQHTSTVRPQGSGLPAGTPASGLPANTPTQVGFSSPQPTAPPPDPEAAEYQARAQRTGAISGVLAQYDIGRTNQEYGFGDSSNPYSRANLLMENFKRGQAGTNVGYAAQGGLYSGAYQTAQQEQQHQYDIGYDRLRRDYQDQIGNIQRGQLQQYGEYGSGLSLEQYNALIRGFGG